MTTADMDGDGDFDILSASFVDDKFAWYENDGTASPSFTEHLISRMAMGLEPLRQPIWTVTVTSTWWERR